MDRLFKASILRSSCSPILGQICLHACCCSSSADSWGSSVARSTSHARMVRLRCSFGFHRPVSHGSLFAQEFDVEHQIRVGRYDASSRTTFAVSQCSWHEHRSLSTCFHGWHGILAQQGHVPTCNDLSHADGEAQWPVAIVRRVEHRVVRRQTTAVMAADHVSSLGCVAVAHHGVAVDDATVDVDVWCTKRARSGVRPPSLH
mmetsp:Transcript_8303/g.51721  ORF Transcript_8303/g.51721 Transcript_8303/m.51721 type:complete len:202 (-) Transcript_8303:4519-5124(-)